MSKSSVQTAKSSDLTFVTLIIIALLTYFVPQAWLNYTVNLQSALLYLASILLLIYLLITIIRRKKIKVSISPLAIPLFLLAALTYFSAFVQNVANPEIALFDIAGQIVGFCCLGIAGSILIKKNNGQVVINWLIGFAGLASIMSFLALLNSFASFLPTWFTGVFYFPFLLNLSLILIGIAAISANFFQKEKFKKSQLVFLPLIIVGLVSTVILYYRLQPVEVPPLATSVEVAKAALVNPQQSGFNLFAFFFGGQYPTYRDAWLSLKPLSYNQSINWQTTYTQAFNLPLTIVSLFGVATLSCWLYLVIRTLMLSLKKTENNYLLFILFISFVIQFFTPIYPLVLIIQAILISFATNRNRQITINLSLPTTVINKEGKEEVVVRDRGRILFTIFVVGLIIVLGTCIIRTTRYYLGYFYYARALNETDDLQSFSQDVERAVQIAPFIDTFHQAKAISYLEMMLADVAQDTAQLNLAGQKEFAQAAINEAQTAISVNPQGATNYYLLAQIYQELIPYTDTATIQTLTSFAIQNYALAITKQLTSPDPYLSLARFYQDQGELDQALTIYQQALALKPDYLLTTYNLAVFYQQQGNFESARQYFQQALELLDANDANFQLYQAQINQQLSGLTN